MRNAPHHFLMLACPHASAQCLVLQDMSDANTDSNSRDGITIALHPLHAQADELLHSDGGSPMAMATAVPPALGLPTAFAASSAAMVAAAATRGLEEDTLVCEAALNLLSMSSGQHQLAYLPSWRSDDVGGTKRPLLLAHHSEPVVARGAARRQPRQQRIMQAPGNQQQRCHQPPATHVVKHEGGAPSDAPCDTPAGIPLPAVGVDLLRRLLPRLSPAQLARLQLLCREFEALRSEVAAAQAAQDAVGRVLQVKQQEARRAAATAAMAARALHEEARKLSGSSDAALQRQKAMAAAVAAAAATDSSRLAAVPAPGAAAAAIVGTLPIAATVPQDRPSPKRARVT